MKDRRGVDRGQCTIQGCPCAEYRLHLSGSQACAACRHPPTKHLAQGGPPLPGVEDGGQSHLSQPETRAFVSSLTEFQSLPAPKYRSDTPLSLHKTNRSLERTSNPFGTPQSLPQPPVVQTMVDPSMQCHYPGCPKPKYVEDGRVHDFCGRIHAAMFNGQGV